MTRYVFHDLVRETASASGLGDYVLLGASPGMFAFGASFADGDPLVYVAYGAGADGLPAAELATGTYDAVGNAVIRGAVLRSTHDDGPIEWGGGNKTIYPTAPAALQLFLDSDGVLAIPLTVSGQKVQAMGNSGTALTLTYANVVTVTLTGNATLTLPTMAINTGEEAQMVLELTQDGTGGRTVALAAPSGETIKYGAGATGVTVLAGANSRTDILVRRKQGENVYYVSALDNWS